MKIISLGWGVQSFTLAAMVALGELEPVDAAVHADTTHESILTYQFAERWTPWLVERGVKVVKVVGDPRPDPLPVRGGLVFRLMLLPIMAGCSTGNVRTNGKRNKSENICKQTATESRWSSGLASAWMRLCG